MNMNMNTFNSMNTFNNINNINAVPTMNSMNFNMNSAYSNNLGYNDYNGTVNNINNNYNINNNINNHLNSTTVAPPITNNIPQPNGGVSLVLDYDLDQMVKFLSWVTFGLVKKNSSPSLGFQKSLESVLSATRLPKSTLLLAVNYLSNKIDDSNGNIPYEYYKEDDIYKVLIVALILSNKFNDDKTFRNKSWSDATNLPLVEINKSERDWLNDCNYELFKTTSYSMVESCWNTWCLKNIQSFEADNLVTPPSTTAAAIGANAPLTPVSTAPSSPLPGNSCYYNDHFISNQIFENPFQQINNTNNSNYSSLLNNKSIVSPAADFHYMNDYYNYYSTNYNTSDCLNNQFNDLGTPTSNYYNGVYNMDYCYNPNNINSHLQTVNAPFSFNDFNYCTATAC